MFEFEIITENFSSYLDGMWLTAQLVGIALAAGLVMAVPLAVMRVTNNPFLYRPVWLYTYFFRGTPMLTQLLVVYYGLAQFQWMQDAWEAQSPFWLLFREPFFCALLAFAVNTCAYTVEIFAGSIRSIPYGEIEAV